MTEAGEAVTPATAPTPLSPEPVDSASAGAPQESPAIDKDADKAAPAPSEDAKRTSEQGGDSSATKGTTDTVPPTTDDPSPKPKEKTAAGTDTAGVPSPRPKGKATTSTDMPSDASAGQRQARPKRRRRPASRDGESDTPRRQRSSDARTADDTGKRPTRRGKAKSKNDIPTTPAGKPAKEASDGKAPILRRRRKAASDTDASATASETKRRKLRKARPADEEDARKPTQAKGKPASGARPMSAKSKRRRKPAEVEAVPNTQSEKAKAAPTSSQAKAQAAAGERPDGKAGARKPARTQGKPASDDRPVNAKAKRRPKAQETETTPDAKSAEAQAAPEPSQVLAPTSSGEHPADEVDARKAQLTDTNTAVQASDEAEAQPKQQKKPSVLGFKRPAALMRREGKRKKSSHVAKHARKKEPKSWKIPRSLDDIRLRTKIVFVLLVIYFLGVAFFSFHFLPRTSVNGKSVSWMSVSDLVRADTELAPSYGLKVTGQGADFSLTPDDLELQFDAEAFREAAYSHIQRFVWPIASFLHQHYVIVEGVSFNESKVASVVSTAVELTNEDASALVDATISYDKLRHTFSPVQEVGGEKLSEEAVLEQVTKAIETMTEEVELNKNAIIKPAVSVSDPRFDEALKEAENFPNLSIDLRLSNTVAEVVDNDLIRSWLTISPDYQVVSDKDAIEEWARGELSAKLDSVGKMRNYVRPDGKQIEIYDGTYGWNIDGAKLATKLSEQIDERSGTPIDVPVTSRAAVYNPGGADWGKRYLDVDLGEQYARMYDESGELIWSSEFVSGNESSDNGTVTGVFYIEDKESPMTLIGLDDDGDGEPDYENDVDFWMSFWGGYGLHDAVWRDSFDYDTYLTDGSHGCINLPYYAAQTLYETIKVADPVVVHW